MNIYVHVPGSSCLTKAGEAHVDEAIHLKFNVMAWTFSPLVLVTSWKLESFEQAGITEPPKDLDDIRIWPRYRSQIKDRNPIAFRGYAYFDHLFLLHYQLKPETFPKLQPTMIGFRKIRTKPKRKPRTVIG